MASDSPGSRIIALTGATGYIGGRLAPQLLAAGYSVRCLVRSPKKLHDRSWARHPRVEIRQVDLEDPVSLRENLHGCEAAYYLVHSMLAAGSAYAARDRQLAASFGIAAHEAGLRQIIYLGGLGETGPALSEHLRSRQEVEAALAAAGVPVTVLRAAMIIGSGSASFEILRYLVERLPVMVTPKWVCSECQPIAVRDVIGYLIGVLGEKGAIGQTFEIGGPDVKPYSEIMKIMAEELGLGKRWIIPVPVLTPRLSSYWIHLVTPLRHDIARPLAEGLRNPVVCHDTRIHQIVPQANLLTIRQSIQAALEGIATRAVETNWSMAGAIPGDPDWAGGTVFRDAREVEVDVPDWALYNAVCRVGGGHGWYAADALWQIRGWIDRLFGGPGLRRGRRDPNSVSYGEALDFWRVTGIEPNRRLTLRAEMILPGEALLEFEIETLAGTGRTRLRQVAMFLPRGLFGLVYWYSVVPLHHIVFRGMLRGIVREARRLALASGLASAHPVR